MFKRFLMTVAAALLMPFAASAAPITYTYAGLGSGSLGNVAFQDTAFVITALGDTANVGPWPCCASLQNTHTSASIQIDGVGSFDFTVPTHTWIAQNCCMGFGLDFGANLLTLFDAAITGVGYGLDTSFAPTLDLGASTQNQFVNIGTTGGALTIASLTRGASFAASTTGTPIPEPSALAVVLLALGLLAASRRGSGARRR